MYAHKKVMLSFLLFLSYRLSTYAVVTIPSSEQRLPTARRACICVGLSGLERWGHNDEARSDEAAISLNFPAIKKI